MLDFTVSGRFTGWAWLLIMILHALGLLHSIFG